MIFQAYNEAIYEYKLLVDKLFPLMQVTQLIWPSVKSLWGVSKSKLYEENIRWQVMRQIQFLWSDKNSSI